MQPHPLLRNPERIANRLSRRALLSVKQVSGGDVEPAVNRRFGPLIRTIADYGPALQRAPEPFGLILKRLGQKPVQTHLFDPKRTKLEIRLGRHMFSIIRFVDRWMGLRATLSGSPQSATSKSKTT